MRGVVGYLVAVGIVGSLLTWGAVKMARGIRNNNPLNIERTGEQWRGMSAQQSDSRFVVFDQPVYGIRAAARILKSYQRRGIQNIAGIVSTWAPAHENDTAAYISVVEQRARISRNQYLTEADYPAVIAAMIYMENGEQPYPLELIQEGVNLA